MCPAQCSLQKVQGYAADPRQICGIQRPYFLGKKNWPRHENIYQPGHFGHWIGELHRPWLPARGLRSRRPSIANLRAILDEYIQGVEDGV